MEGEPFCCMAYGKPLREHWLCKRVPSRNPHRENLLYRAFRLRTWAVRDTRPILTVELSGNMFDLDPRQTVNMT